MKTPPIILVTNPTSGHSLGEFIRRLAPRRRIVRTEDRAVLERVCAEGALLIAFCTATIVPRRVLQRLGGPAYNFHPGPPTHPGVRPEAFALYAGDPVFGATAHEMAPRVDTGPIVDVEWFDVPPHLDQRALGDLAFAATVRLFARVAPRLVAGERPTPMGVDWAPRAWTFADYRDLRTIPPTATSEEAARRLRCAHADPERPAVLHMADFVWRVSPL